MKALTKPKDKKTFYGRCHCCGVIYEDIAYTSSAKQCLTTDCNGVIIFHPEHSNTGKKLKEEVDNANRVNNVLDALCVLACAVQEIDAVSTQSETPEGVPGVVINEYHKAAHGESAPSSVPLKDEIETIEITDNDSDLETLSKPPKCVDCLRSSNTVNCKECDKYHKRYKDE